MSTIGMDIKAGQARDYRLLHGVVDVLEKNELTLWNLSYSNLGLGVVIQATAENGIQDYRALEKQFHGVYSVTDVKVTPLPDLK